MPCAAFSFCVLQGRKFGDFLAISVNLRFRYFIEVIFSIKYVLLTNKLFRKSDEFFHFSRGQTSLAINRSVSRFWRPGLAMRHF